MFSKRWIVELAAPELIELLTPEHRELATCIEGARGESLLVFRDNMTAYKAAALTGSQARPGRLVAEGAGGLPYEDGRRLLLEPVPAEDVLRA